MRRRLQRSGAVLVAAALLSGCTGAEPVDVAASADDDGVEADAAPDSTEPGAPEGAAPVWPLTGEPTAGAGPTSGPVLAVRVANDTDARPQTGLDRADLVFETVVDGTHTRLTALYHRHRPREVGPTRSTRLIELGLLAPFRPVYVAEATAGSYQRALDDLGAVPVVPSRRERAFVEQPAGGQRPAGVYVRPEGLRDDLAAAAPATAPALTFADESACDDCPAAEAFDVAFGIPTRVHWDWQADGERYHRRQDGEEQRTAEGAPVAATNILVLEVPYPDETCCRTEPPSLEQLGLVGSGPGVLHRDGRARDVTWQREHALAHLELAGADGGPAPALRPGSTWIELVPDGRVSDADR